VEASFSVNRLPDGAEWLKDFDTESTSMLLAIAGDLVLVVDGDDVVREAAVNSPELRQELGPLDQTNKPWRDAVVADSHGKMEAILRDARIGQPPRWVQINLFSGRRTDLPLLCAAIRIGVADRVVVIGRDLLAVSVLQQKLVDAQQSMERDYLRLRHVETRYRLLFQMSSEAVLIIDSGSIKIQDANPASQVLLGSRGKPLSGRDFTDLFGPNSRSTVEALLTHVRSAGRADEVAVNAADGRELLVSASLFRQDNASFFLVRVVPAADLVAAGPSSMKAALIKSLDVAPDGFVLTSPDGRILAANAAFREMAQLTGEEQARAGSLEQWLGRPGVDMNVMIATLRQRGTVSLFATTVRGEYGETSDVEISAVSVIHAGQTCYGFFIRNVGRRLPADSRIGRDLPRSVDQLAELIGRVPLKDLVREATDMIERLCIQAALELTGDNKASAAELLGLSRQSLYVKLRRHGLGDLSDDDEGAS
jgi:transcriptional regulator PpsR